MDFSFQLLVKYLILLLKLTDYESSYASLYPPAEHIEITLNLKILLHEAWQKVMFLLRGTSILSPQHLMLASLPEVRMKKGLDETHLSSGKWFSTMPKLLLLISNFRKLLFTLPEVITVKTEGLNLIIFL